MAETGARDRSHLTLDLKGLKPQPNNDSGLSPILVPSPSLYDTSLALTPEKIAFATQQQHQLQSQFQQNHHNHLQHHQILETPTPSNYFPKNPTSAQESFAEGFVEVYKKIQQAHIQEAQKTTINTINNSPSTLKFLHTLFGLSPNGTVKNFLAHSAQQQTALVGRLSPNGGTAAKNFLTQSHTLPSSNANNQQQQLLPGTDVSTLRLDVPKIVLTDNNNAQSNNNNNNYSNNNNRNSLISTAAGAASTEEEQSQQNSPVSVGSSTGGAATSPFSIVSAGGDIAGAAAAAVAAAATTTNSFMDYHLAHLGQLSPVSPAVTTPSNNVVPVGGFDFFQPQLGQFNASAAIGMMAHHAPSKDVKKEPTNKSNMGGDHDLKKLERKRARNRLAASKCRQRKMQRITDLEQQVSEERERGSELQMQINQLQSVIRDLEERLKANQHQHPLQQHNMTIMHRQNS